MLLKKLYTTPDYLFEPVEFKEGINYIFGKKEPVTNKEQKNSLNGIGKSTFLDLIDFALCSSYQKDTAQRLKAAYNVGVLKGISVVLEFEVDNKLYAICRSFDEPSKILFSINDEGYKDFRLDNIKPYLCDLIFKRDNYKGIYSDKWLRQLLPFFIKIQPPEKVPFQNPIEYIQEENELKLNQYHFFLLNIDNNLAHQNCELQQKLTDIKTAIIQTEKIIREVYGVATSSQIKDRIRKLEIEIESLEESIKTFKLAEKYKIDENKANELTAVIKKLWFENSTDEQKLKSYNDSLKLDVNIYTPSIKKLYAEFNTLLGENIKKTLDEAVRFRRDLVSSRTEFISEEIKRLENDIIEKTKLIDKKEDERAQIFKMLKSKKAITDLSEAYYTVNRKRESLGELESKTRILNDLQKKEVQINSNINIIVAKILDFKDTIRDQERIFSKNLIEIYNSLYPELKDSSIFDITPNPKSHAKIQFTVLTNNEMFSKGRNQGRTLVYDLAVLFHAIEHNIKMPRFLIHDGILDGMDKSHFIDLVEFLEEKKLQGKKFQYIMTINEEGTLSDKFGHADKVNPSVIEKEAILILTPNKKLLAPSFDIPINKD